MPFLSTDKFGPGPLYDFSTADRSAYLTQGTTYFQTSASSWAIQQDVFDSTFVCAGEIGSNGVGIRASTNGGSRIDVTTSGYLSADAEAIFILAPGRFTVTNAGTITSNEDAIRLDAVDGSSLTVTNSGTIQAAGGGHAIYAGASTDVVRNTGTIVGDVSLGAGQDYVDTHLGRITGTIYGGSGDDHYVIGGSETISESPDGGFDSVASFGDYALTLYVEILELFGTASTGWGNAFANQLFANTSDSTLYGQGGNDSLNGSGGNDVLYGGAGDDSLLANTGEDRLFGGRGNDQIYGSADGATIDGGAGDDRIRSVPGGSMISGGSGVDRLSYAAASASLTIDMRIGTASDGVAAADVFSGIENIEGGNGADRIVGDKKANALDGLNGDDQLVGGGGDDLLFGGSGADSLDGGVGNDTAIYAATTATAVTLSLLDGSGTVGSAAGDTFVSIENVVGTSGGDTISGSNAANVLHGGNDNDILRGVAGADMLFGDEGDDQLYGDAGADVIGFADVEAGSPGGWGIDLVFGFQDGADRISFVGASAIHSLADLTVSVVRGDVQITTSVAGDVIRLVGFDPGALDASDFIFAPAADRPRFDDGDRIQFAAPEFAALP